MVTTCPMGRGRARSVGPTRLGGQPRCPSPRKPRPETAGARAGLGGSRALTIAQDGPAEAQSVCGPRAHVLHQPMLYLLQHWDQVRRGLSEVAPAAGAPGHPCPPHDDWLGATPGGRG